MQALLPWLFVLVLAFFAWVMITRRLSASLALPLAAICLALLALLPTALGPPPPPAADGTAVPHGLSAALQSLFADVVESGIARLAGAIFAVLLGAVLAAQLRLSGAAERVVRYAAEYAPEDRFRLGLLMLLLISLLFTSLGGLGAVILVASITLPLLFSLGYEPKVAATLFLFGLSLGGCLNPVNWAFYIDATKAFPDELKLSPEKIVPFALTMAGLFLLVCLVYLFSQLGGWRTVLRQILPLGILVGAGAVLGWLALTQQQAWHWIKLGLSWLLLGLLAVLVLALLWRLLSLLLAAGKPASEAPESLRRSDGWLAASGALVPLLLLLWSSLSANLSAETAKLTGGEPAPALAVPLLTALLAGIIYSALASASIGSSGTNLLMRSLQEGVAAASPAVVLLMGIGLLLQATALPAVAGSLSPWLAALPIATPIGFVMVFFVLSPLALYRGPLNLYGMGAGVVGIMLGSALVSSGQVPPSLIMVAFFTVGMLQGVCDPTNTHNVWVANFCKVPVGEITRHTLPWILALVLAGLAAGAAMYAG